MRLTRTGREEQVAQVELDLNRNREALETREGDLAKAMARHEEEVTRHKGHVKKADERLAKRKVDQDQEHEARLHTARNQVSKEYASKFKRQEEHFRKRSGDDAPPHQAA